MVLDMLSKWWQVLVATLRQSRPNMTFTSGLLRAEWFAFYPLLCREVLDEDEFDLDEVMEACAEEWAQESTDGAELSRGAFLDSIFEVRSRFSKSRMMNGSCGGCAAQVRAVTWMQRPHPSRVGSAP